MYLSRKEETVVLFLKYNLYSLNDCSNENSWKMILRSSNSQYHIETCLFYQDYNEAVYFNLKYNVPMELANEQ